MIGMPLSVIQLDFNVPQEQVPVVTLEVSDSQYTFNIIQYL